MMNSALTCWPSVRLEEVTSRISKGESPTWQGFSYCEEGVRFIRSENVLFGSFSLAPQTFVPSEFHEKLSRSKVKSGDVLINLVGASIGRACVAPDKLGEANVNQAVAVVSTTERLNPAYLLAFMLGDQAQQYIRNAQVDMARANINLEDVRRLQIPLPPLAEQQRIVELLQEQMTEVERARAAVQAQLAAAQALPAAVLRAHFSTPAALRWPRRRLGELCEIVAKQVDPREKEFSSLPHVSGENIESGLCRLKNVRSAGEDGMISGKYLFEVGDVLYSKLRPYLRKVAIAESRGLCSADMYPIRVNADLLDAHFTAWLLLGEEFSSYAIEESQRSRMPKLNREELFRWSAPVPPLAEQRALAARLTAELSAATALRTALQTRLAAIERLPAALLRAAFTPAAAGVCT